MSKQIYRMSVPVSQVVEVMAETPQQAEQILTNHFSGSPESGINIVSTTPGDMSITATLDTYEVKARVTAECEYTFRLKAESQADAEATAAAESANYIRVGMLEPITVVGTPTIVSVTDVD